MSKKPKKRVSAAEAADIFKGVKFRFDTFGLPTYVRPEDAADAEALLDQGEREDERQRREELIAGVREAFGLPAGGGARATRSEIDAGLARLKAKAKSVTAALRSAGETLEETLARQTAGTLHNDISGWLTLVAGLSESDKAHYRAEELHWTRVRAEMEGVIAEAGGSVRPGLWTEAGDDADDDEADPQGAFGSDFDDDDDDGPPPPRRTGPRVLDRLHGAAADFDSDLAESADEIAERDGVYRGPITITGGSFAGAKLSGGK